ncbi:MAG TPA: Nif3-like dinuclear metal center hexameric protein, partial [Rectinemataceae bacterium]|nr:Nif3-like dinuclear metal center hexameric protein [Rectinemataceae bacterium]
GLLEIDALARIDVSLNGIQIGRRPGRLSRVAFAVDACAESAKRAVEAGAQVLFVHHGLFWGQPYPVVGSLLERLRIFLDADLALYACHLPLDKHPEIGHNAVLARNLGMERREPFGEYHGVDIGFKGRLPSPLTLDEVVKRVLPDGSRPMTLIPGKKAEIETVAVISGGAAKEASQAIEQGIDLYVTGEPSHNLYHTVVESGMAFLAAGHYATEVWGLKALAAKMAADTDLKTVFIDLPTGL